MEESKEVEGFQQLLSARTQVSPPRHGNFGGSPPPIFGVPPFGGGGIHRPLPQEFIEELLSPPFGGMIAFVKEAEALLEKGQLERLRGEEGKGGGRGVWEGGGAHFWGHPAPTMSPFPARVTQLARGFSNTWKASVESLSQDVMRSFSNFKNGTGIIQVGAQGILGRGGGAQRILGGG